ncbi:MAG: thiamine phosphate synthase [Gammaproteobacteria bacterium]
MSTPSRSLHGLYAVTDHILTAGDQLLPAVQASIRGGARLVQYRDKTHEHLRRKREARALRQLCREHEVLFIINDDVALAAETGADGVHLGQDDAALEEARVQLGPRAVIGVSCYDSLHRAVTAAHAGADYVAFGSFFASPTKPEAVPAPLSLLEEAHRQLTIPICAIGGITPENGSALIRAGADMLAVISGLFGVADTETATHRYTRLFQ